MERLFYRPHYPARPGNLCIAVDANAESAFAGCMNNRPALSSDFIVLLGGVIYPFRENLRGTQHYMESSERNQYAQKLISELEARGRQMTRSDQMYLNYHLKPYMRTFSREEYAQRWGDIQTNITRINKRGLISLADPKKEPIWIQRFSDLLAEQQYRGGLPKDLPRSEAVRSFLANRKNKIVVDDETYMLERAIFKFGAQSHIRASFENEVLRFMPASYYASPELNSAQKDSETSFSFILMPEVLNELDGLSGLLPFEVNDASGRLTVQFDTLQEYYMWCASDRFDPRTPYAFNYDTMLAIYDKKKFLKDIRKSLMNLGGTNTKARSVDYFDPYTELSTNVDVAFAKHFRFSYQKEFRIVTHLKRPPSPIFVRVPGLKSYSEVVSFK